MKIFYRHEQVVASRQSSPSALKPLLVVSDWRKDPLIKAEICSFEPASIQTLVLAHHPHFVRSVLRGRC